MTLDTLKTAEHVIGIKQVTKAVKRGSAKVVFLATDADARVIAPLAELCDSESIERGEAATMKELGSACGIEVGAAAVAVLHQSDIC